MREATNAILELVADGILDPVEALRAALGYMSEADVRDLGECEGWAAYAHWRARRSCREWRISSRRSTARGGASMYEDLNIAFTLRLRPFRDRPTIMVRVWDDAYPRLDVEVRQGGKAVFAKGELWCGLPRCGGKSSDGEDARRLVCDLIGMAPGDTDAEYFAGYSEAQLAWAREYGEAVRAEGEVRYGGE